jgi:D-serine deaminase-like pyridoxal phosphate-dependent protein
MRVQDLDTPVVTIHLDVMEDNIRRVQAHLDGHGIGNRAHIKTHKVPAIGRLQLAGGASGIVCQKIGEIEVFADHGVAPDVMLTYNIIGRSKLDRLMAVARRVERLTVVLDNEVVARGLSEAGVRHGLDVRFVVECDTGGARNGVPTPQAAFDLAQSVMKLPRMDFQGLMTFPNKDPDTRIFFERALELFKRVGIPVPIVSGAARRLCSECTTFRCSPSTAPAPASSTTRRRSGPAPPPGRTARCGSARRSSAGRTTPGRSSTAERRS